MQSLIVQHHWCSWMCVYVGMFVFSNRPAVRKLLYCKVVTSDLGSRLFPTVDQQHVVLVHITCGGTIEDDFRMVLGPFFFFSKFEKHTHAEKHFRSCKSQGPPAKSEESRAFHAHPSEGRDRPESFAAHNTDSPPPLFLTIIGWNCQMSACGEGQIDHAWCFSMQTCEEGQKW